MHLIIQNSAVKIYVV